MGEEPGVVCEGCVGCEIDGVAVVGDGDRDDAGEGDGAGAGGDAGGGGVERVCEY